MHRWKMALIIVSAAGTGVGAGKLERIADMAMVERAAVERAVLDYAESLYERKPELVDRGVHPELAKRGFGRNADGAYRESTMTFAQLRSLADRWNAQGRVNPATARKQVVVLDLLDQTASAKLVAEWGIDYLHLAKYDGEWKIVNVLWQVEPRARK